VEVTQAVAGIDPHKHSATLAVVDELGRLSSCTSFAIDLAGIEELLTVLRDTELVIDRIGVEGSASLGQPVVLALAAAGYDVREVQPNRTADRRRRRRRAKSDIEDAEAIARETLADPWLPPAGKWSAPDPHWQALTAIRDWRQSLVLQRVRLLNEAEAVLVSLPLTLRSGLPATSRVLTQLRALHDGTVDLPDDLALADQVKLDRLAATFADVTSLTGRITELDRQVPALLDELGCTLNTICGIGVVSAMDLVCEIGDPARFRTEAQFARWCGAAPIATSSGEGDGPVLRHRLDLGGNRAVNSILHIVHVTQIRCHPPAKDYMSRCAAKQKTKRSARRSHKRHLANVIIRHMWHDAERLRTPAGTLSARVA
jgi:transposase